MDTIEYLVHRAAYWFIAFMTGMLPVFLVTGILMTIAGPALGWLPQIILAATGLPWLFATSWIAHNAAHRRTFGREGFMDALWNAVDEGRFLLRHAPLIVWLLGRRGNHDARFDKPPDPTRHKG